MAWQKQINTILFSLLATFLIILASISLWFYKDIYNRENFEQHVSQALQTPESREAIAAFIIEESFKNRPLLRNLLSEQATSLLAGILDGPRLQSVVDRFILQVHDVLFSSEPKAIAIDISRVKNLVSNLGSFLELITERERRDISIPDQIVLVEAGVIPSIANIGLTILWIGPIALIVGLGLILWLMLRSIDKISTVKILGISLAVETLIVILFLEWYKPVFLSMFKNIYVHTVAAEVLNEFLKSLTNQNLLLFFIGIVLVAGGFLYQLIFLRNRPPRQGEGKIVID
jgi:hypothetical protein